MQSKKFKVLIIICVILVLTTAALNFFAMKKKNNSLPLPAETNQPSNTPNTLPEPVSSRDKTYPVKKDSALNEIEAAFKRFVSERPEKEVMGAQFVDEQGEKLTFNELSQALSVKLSPDLEKLIDPTSYNIFYCARGTEKQFSLIFYLAPPTDNSISNMSIAEDKMKKWEPSLLKDMHSLLFPNVYFSPEQLDQALAFKDGQARFTEVILPGGVKSSINYRFYGDPLVISSSPECLKKAEDYYFDIEDGE